MIVGSIYLGKKAKKAYRKHQAQKAAERLAGALEPIDPSEELVNKAPPSSPELQARALSPTESISSRNTLSTYTTYDTSSPVKDQEWQQYAERMAVDPVSPSSEPPPTYDAAMSASSERSTWDSSQEFSPNIDSRMNLVPCLELDADQTWPRRPSRPELEAGDGGSHLPRSGTFELEVPDSAVSELPAEGRERVELPTDDADVSEIDADSPRLSRLSEERARTGFVELPA